MAASGDPVTGARRAKSPIMTARMDTATGPDASSAPSVPSGPRRTSLTILLLLFVGFISLGLPDGLLGVGWPSIRQTFGLPIDALGALFLTMVCGYLAASLTSGWLVRRLGVGRLLTLSAFATAISLLTFALAPVWTMIVVVGVMAGAGGGAIDAGLNSYVALLHTPRLLSWLHACFGIGAALGPAIMTGVLGAGLPWETGYVVVGTCQVVLGISFLLTRREWELAKPPTPQRSIPLAPCAGEGEQTGGASSAGAASPAPTRHGKQGTETEQARSWRSFGPAVWLSVLLFLVYTGIETTGGQWAYSLFVEGRGVAAQVAGLAVSAYWGALALGRVLGGIVADRIAPATLTRWSMAGMLAGAVLVAVNLSIWLSFGGLVLVGLSAASVFPSLIGVTPQRFGAGAAPTIIGFQVGAAALGIAGLPALSGVLAGRLGLEVIPLVMVVSSLVMLGLHEVVVRLAASRAMVR
jgi:fucose permease